MVSRFTDEAVELQRGEGTCPRFRSCCVGIVIDVCQTPGPMACCSVSASRLWLFQKLINWGDQGQKMIAFGSRGLGLGLSVCVISNTLPVLTLPVVGPRSEALCQSALLLESSMPLSHPAHHCRRVYGLLDLSLCVCMCVIVRREMRSLIFLFTRVG